MKEVRLFATIAARPFFTFHQADGPNDIKELFLPGPNAFIPTNLDVEKCEVDTVSLSTSLYIGQRLRQFVQPAKRPYLIRQTALSSLWYKKDDQFWVPRAHVQVQILRFDLVRPIWVLVAYAHCNHIVP